MDGIYFLSPCSYCGKTFKSTRKDRRTCQNSCSSALNRAELHNYLTPYQKYLKQQGELNENVDQKLILPLTKNEVNNHIEHDEVAYVAEDEEQNISAKLLQESEKLLESTNKN